jgi:UDP-N-acetylmuramoyl-L-alanyl-D-glutamate--2,6-diaminopimelate ligase
MRLSEILPIAEVAPLRPLPIDPEVGSVAIDSRKVRAGALFCAVPGTVRDGNEWADSALAAGAAAVLTDRPEFAELPGRVLVASVARAVGPLCRAVLGNPDQGTKIVVVTGTNGKTSSAYLAEAIFQAAGLKPALSSTVALRHPGGESVASLTTPDAVSLWEFVREAVDAGARSLVLETSSHALHQGRIGGIRADAAVFTNLSRDHLDYHGTMEEYFEAKFLLFRDHLAQGGVAVSNVDDPWGRILADRLGPSCATVSTGGNPAKWRIEDLRTTLDGNRFHLVSAGVDLELRSPLVGEVFARNLAGVAVAALGLGIPGDAVKKAAAATRVPGRCEVVRCGSFRGAVDYAHTPDALERLLEGLRPLVKGKLVCVFGCGGDRDKGKRPLMGGIAARLSDLAVVTSDNPRTEDPEAIIADILAGIPAGARTMREPERAEAIRRAADLLEPGDFLVVAGKGHERYQIVGAERRPFDDVQELSTALMAREGSACPR